MDFAPKSCMGSNDAVNALLHKWDGSQEFKDVLRSVVGFCVQCAVSVLSIFLDVSMPPRASLEVM